MSARQLDRLVGVFWSVAIAVLALGHLTALRNVTTIGVALASLALYARRIDAFPCKSAALAILAFAAASIAWSPVPTVSWSKWRTDLAIPILAGAGCFVFVRATGGFRAVIVGLVGGIVALAVLSAFAYLPPSVSAALPSWFRLEPAAGIVRPLPHWYPGPGDASMFAILSIPALYVATVRSRSAGRAWRRMLLSAWPLLAFVLITTNNRNAILLAPAVLALVAWLDRRRSAGEATPVVDSLGDRVARRRKGATIALVALFVVVVLGMTLEWGARERLKYLNRPLEGESAALTLAVADTRPAIWRYYAEHALVHPWFGMGFGRTVPGIGWKTEADRSLAALEPNAYIHAHNLLLNWWLQLGVIGVGLLLAAAFAIARASRGLHGRDTKVLTAAVQATLAATLLRNLTDDFLVYGMATAFCVVIAALLGDGDRGRETLARADFSAPRNP